MLSFLAFSCGGNEPSSGGNNNNGSNNENNNGNNGNGNNNNENQGNSDPEGDPDPAPASISLSSNSFNLDSDGGYLEVTITSSDDWTLSGFSNWCYPSQTYGKSGDIVSFSVSPNSEYDERNVTFTFLCGNVSAKMTIIQKQLDALTLTTDRFELPQKGGEITIEIKANVSFSYSIDDLSSDWIKIKNTRSIETHTLIFSVMENPSIEKREGIITITSGDLSEIVHVYQNGEIPTIVLSKNYYEANPEGESILIEVTSNVDIDVEYPEEDWIKFNSMRTLSSHSYYFDIESNPTGKERSASIAFINKRNNLKELVTIHQHSLPGEGIDMGVGDWENDNNDFGGTVN